MRKIMYRALVTMILALAIFGCATVPPVTKGASNYLEKGMVSATLKDNSFYMAIGDVNLYNYGLFGDLQPSGKTVEIAVAIQADKDTGEVLKIATMESNNEGAGLSGIERRLSDLQGGISIIDVQPYPRWLDAIQAMRDAISRLSAYTTYVNNDQGGLVVVAAPPVLIWPWWEGRIHWHGRYRR